MIHAAIITAVWLAALVLSSNAAGQKPEESGSSAAADRHPGDQALQRLSRMTPEQREKALANLPPQRRQEILQKLEEFQTLPSPDRQRVAAELERLHELPPRQQNQVRRALRQLQALPDDRKALVRKEMDRLSAMPEPDRRARMNSEEFRNLYSPSEQQLMSNLAAVLPESK